MSIIEEEFASALADPVKRNVNKTKNLRSKASKVSSGVPEVMVKITTAYSNSLSGVLSFAQERTPA